MTIAMTVVDGKKVLAQGTLVFAQEANVYLAAGGGFRFRLSTVEKRSIDGDMLMIEDDFPAGITGAGNAGMTLHGVAYRLFWTVRRAVSTSPALLEATYVLLDDK